MTRIEFHILLHKESQRQTVHVGPQSAERVALVLKMASLLFIIQRLLLLSGDVEKNPGPLGQHTEDPSFTFINIISALEAIIEWKTLGTQLDISATKIKEIDVNNQGQVAECKHDMVQFWLESDTSCSWKKLVEALSRCQKLLLAERIQTTFYEVGGPHNPTSPRISPEETQLKKAVNKNYYTIVLLGKTGQGKSTTGNRLLGITNGSKPPIKEWRWESDAGLLKHTDIPDGEVVSFKTNSSTTCVTQQCQMLSNEDTSVRVLNVPGFSDSRPKENLTTLEVNAGFIDAIVNVQSKLVINYNSILYFLPFRGAPQRADAYLEDEFYLLFQYFGISIFQCMIMIATKDEEDQDCELTAKQYGRLSDIIKLSLQQVTMKDVIQCPPIIYLPLEATAKEILARIQNAPVVKDSSLNTAGTIRQYKGDSSWFEWIESFEAAASKHSMDDIAKVQWLKALLSGPLKTSLKDVRPINFSKAKEVLCLKLFSMRERKSYEQWCDVAKELTALAKHGCPDKEQYDYEEMVKERILILADDSTLHKTISLQHLINILMAKEAIPQIYSGRVYGETSWDSWIQKFESAVVKNQLDDHAKVEWLQARLTDDALQTFNELHSKGSTSYALLRRALHTKVYAERFNARGKKDNETFEGYAKILLELYKEAYPDNEEKEKNLKVLHRLKPHMHSCLQSRPFTSVDEAILADCAINTIKDPFRNHSCDDWINWIAFFEDKCKEQCLDSSKRLLWLEIRLAEKALKCYEEIPAQSRTLYETAKREFQVKLYKNSFEAKCKCRLVVTRVKQLANELSELANGAFPDASKSSRDGIVLKQILNMTKEKGLEFNLQPQTVQEAVHFVLAVNEIPYVYTGGKEWYGWVEKVKKLLSHAEILNNHERVRCISSRLRGKALELFQDASKQEGVQFEDILTNFQKKLYNYWLQMTRDTSQGWEAYAHELLMLGEKVPYSKKQCEKFVLDHMLMQVSEPYKSRNWTSLEEAMNIISAADEIPTYSNADDETWEIWIKKFEDNAAKYSFSDDKKVARLASRLVDGAKEAFDNLHVPPLAKIEYSGIVEQLTTSLYVQKFTSKQRKETQDLYKYKEELMMLAHKAYPYHNKEQVEGIVLQCILEKAKKHHKSRKWASLEEAIYIISAAEDDGLTILCDENHTEIFHMTKKACSNWSGIGRELGFTEDEITAIIREPGRTGEEDYYSSMLRRWLDWAPPNHHFPSVQKLSSVLRAVNKERLAFNLDLKYSVCTSN